MPNGTTAKEFYEQVRDELGDFIQITRTLSKREFTDGKWEYIFIFDKGELFKVEGCNGRESLELYTK